MELRIHGGLRDLARREAFDQEPQGENKVTESRSYIESFLDYADAFMFLEHTLLDHKDWLITDGGVRYVNHHWQAYVTFERKAAPDGTQATLW